MMQRICQCFLITGTSASPAPEKEDLEQKHVKHKDLHHLKFPALPQNAGAFRQWRNSVVPMLSAYDRSADGSVHEWVMKAMRARTEGDVADLQRSSGDYQLSSVQSDHCIRANAPGAPEEPLKFQGFLEDSESLSQPLRGQVLSNMVRREFDTDSPYGAVVLEWELFSLPPPEGSMVSLKAERPAERLMSKWLFERLKKVPAFRRHTDHVTKAPEGCEERKFDWLWTRLERTILEGQQEQNLQSIQDCLRKGPRKESTTGAATAAEKESP